MVRSGNTGFVYNCNDPLHSIQQAQGLHVMPKNKTGSFYNDPVSKAVIFSIYLFRVTCPVLK